MAAVPIRERIVEVNVRLASGGWAYGSGLMIAQGRVLTSAHVLSDAVEVRVTGVDKVERETRLDASLVGDVDQFDVALVDVIGAPELDDVSVARIDHDVVSGNVGIEGCWAAGYPQFQDDEVSSGAVQRQIAHVRGVISPLAGTAGDRGLPSLEVTATPREMTDSPWRGMSGAAVFAGERLLGVVTQHAPRRGVRDIMFTPLDRLGRGDGSDTTQWLERLGTGAVDTWPSLPAREVQLARPYGSTLRSLRQRTPILVGRTAELAALEAYATGSSDAFGVHTTAADYLWLQGSPWAGKTALLAEAAHMAVEGVDVVAFFVSARESQITQEQFLSATTRQLAALLGRDGSANSDVDEFRRHWDAVAQRARAEGRSLVLIVDGLDEAPRIASVLPSDVARHARVIVASRGDLDVTPYVPSEHPLLRAATFELSASDAADEVRALASQELAALLDGNHASSAISRRILGVLAAALGGLTVDDLSAIASVEPEAIEDILEGPAARSLEHSGGTHPRYRLAHKGLQDACRLHRSVGNPRYWEMITAWADSWALRAWPARDDDTGTAGTPIYLLDTYPLALMGAEEELIPSDRTARLTAVVSNLGWIDTAVDALGVDVVLSTIAAVARRVPGDPVVRSTWDVLRRQAHLLSDDHHRNGYVAAQLAWEALRSPSESPLADRAREAIDVRARPTWLPVWTSAGGVSSLLGVVNAHESAVATLQVTERGLVVSGGDDGMVRAWDPTRPDAEGRVLSRHEGGVDHLVVESGGGVVSSGFDGLVRRWDPDEPDAPGRVIIRHEGGLQSLIATEWGVVTGGAIDDGRVRCWQRDEPAPPDDVVARHDCAVLAVLGTSSRAIASSDENGVVRLSHPGRSGRSDRVISRHDLGVWRLAQGTDGAIASGGEDGVVRYWDPARSETTGRAITRHEGSVSSLEILPTGQVVSAARGEVRLWSPSQPADTSLVISRHDGWVRWTVVTPTGDVASCAGAVVKLWRHDDPLVESQPVADHGRSVISSLVVTPTSDIITGCLDGEVRYWDASRPTDPARLIARHGDEVTSIAVSPEGTVVSAGKQGTLRVWHRDAGSEISRPIGRHEGITSLAFATSAGVATGGQDGLVHYWRLDGHDRKEDVGEQTLLFVAPTGVVVTNGADRRVRVWDPDRPESRGLSVVQHPDGHPSLKARLTNSGIGVSAGDETVLFWDRYDDRGPAGVAARHDGWVRAITSTPEGKVISVGGSEVRCWNPDRPGDRGRLLTEHDQETWSVCVAASGHVVSWGHDDSVWVWDPERPERRGRVAIRHDGGVRSVAVADSGAVASGGKDRVARFWGVDWLPSEAHVISHHKSWVERVAFTSTGQVASFGGGEVRLWDPDDPEPPGRLIIRPRGPIGAIAMSPSGGVVLLDRTGDVCVWEPTWGDEPWRVITRHGNAPSGARSFVLIDAQGGVVSSCGTDVRRWDPSQPEMDGQVISRHEALVTALATPATGFVLSGGSDGAVRAWDPGDGSVRLAEVLGRQDRPIETLQVSDSGHVVVVARGISQFALPSFV